MKYIWLFLTILVACNPVAALPRPTGTSIPEITPTLVLPSEIPVRPQLRQPLSGELLKILDAVLLTEKEFTHNEDVETAILEREPGSIQHLIGEDFERYYSNGFPHAEDLVTSQKLPWEMQSFGDLSDFSPILRIALLQYINNHQDVLSNKSFQLPNVKISTFSMDLDGDGNLEWLVGAEYEEYSLQNWLFFNKQSDGLYHFLPSFDYDLAGVQEYGTDIEIQDLTGDGSPEIIKIQHFYLAGGIHGDIKVYSWREGRLSLLESIPLPSTPPIYGESSSYTIGDFDGDGLAEVRVDSPQVRRFGCEWTKSSNYYLDGRSPDQEVTGEAIPPTNKCLIARALESKDPTKQVKLYQEAISKFDVKDSPQDELAWLRLHVAMAYAANGDDQKARAQLKVLNSMEGHGKFLEFIKSVFQVSGSSPLNFCDTLYTTAQSQFRYERIGSEIDTDLANYGYPIDAAPVADLICPFPDVLRARLAGLKIPVTESPIKVLTSKGYSFGWTESLDWDHDTVQEWLGVLKFTQPILVLFDDSEIWKIESIEIHPPVLSDFETAIYRPMDSNKPKILFLFSSESGFCNPPNTEKSLIVVDPNTKESDYQGLCDSKEYSLASEEDIKLSTQAFSKPHSYEEFKAPDWYYLPETPKNEYERRTILDLMDEIENGILTHADSEKVNSDIFNLVSSLPKDDLAAQFLLNRLHYLQGLNYELSGQNNLAVDTYLDLIRSSPESEWSKLAKARTSLSQP